MRDDLIKYHYGNSGFYNYGYWTQGISNQREASENLVNKLLDWIPSKQGNILDVACGMGASTKMLLDYYPPEKVIGLNYSDIQLTAARELAPGADFVQMDGACLGFPDESIDNLICVEAAFHFNTRDDFFREAFRVLKPGGRIVHSDILGRFKLPIEANYLKDPSDLAQHLTAAGFDEVEVLDATKECWQAYARGLALAPWRGLLSRQIGITDFIRGLFLSTPFIVMLGAHLTHYTLSQARKPESAEKPLAGPRK